MNLHTQCLLTRNLIGSWTQDTMPVIDLDDKRAIILQRLIVTRLYIYVCISVPLVQASLWLFPFLHCLSGRISGSNLYALACTASQITMSGIITLQRLASKSPASQWVAQQVGVIFTSVGVDETGVLIYSAAIQVLGLPPDRTSTR